MVAGGLGASACGGDDGEDGGDSTSTSSVAAVLATVPATLSTVSPSTSTSTNGTADGSASEGVGSSEVFEPKECSAYTEFEMLPMKLCDRGGMVRLVQEKLQVAGYSLESDGYFGPSTHQAVAQFQFEQGLYLDGVVGETVFELLTGFEPPSSEAVNVTVSSVGVDALRFGDPAETTVDVLTARFGPASTDETTEFPVVGDYGGFESLDGEVGFDFAYGREVCFVAKVCVVLGGNTSDGLALVGWHTLYEDAVTVDGLRVGSRWSDFPGLISVIPGSACYQTAGGDAGGVHLWLTSDGTWFEQYDEATGTYTEGFPDPADVTVYKMEAGTQVLALVGDC